MNNVLKIKISYFFGLRTIIFKKKVIYSRVVNKGEDKAKKGQIEYAKKICIAEKKLKIIPKIKYLTRGNHFKNKKISNDLSCE